jgi:hypothetical protein
MKMLLKLYDEAKITQTDPQNDSCVSRTYPDKQYYFIVGYLVYFTVFYKG